MTTNDNSPEDNFLDDDADKKYIDLGDGMIFPLCAESAPPQRMNVRPVKFHTPEQLSPLSEKKIAYHERIAAAKITTSVSELQKYASDSTVFVRKAVAGNPATPDFILEILATDDAVTVRRAIVARKDVTAWILELIFRSSMEFDAKDGFCLDEQVVLEIVRHSQVPETILEDVTTRHLIHGQTSPLLMAIISHQNVTNRILRKIADSPNQSIRLTLAKHVKSRWLLQDLSSDSDEQVQQIAMKRLREEQ
jgi:hypothetical protein